jgi:hypothetical protein
VILPALRTHLLSFTDLTNKIGARVFINRAPDKTPVPYILISSFAGDTPYSLQGEVGIGQPMIQVAVWDRDPNGPDKVTTVVELVRDKMSGWRGEWGDVFVCDCSLQGEPILNSEAPDDKSDNWWHSGNLDFQVTHRRPVPSLS